MTITQDEIDAAQAEAQKLWAEYEEIQAKQASVLQEVNVARNRWKNAYDRAKALEMIGRSGDGS